MKHCQTDCDQQKDPDLDLELGLEVAAYTLDKTSSNRLVFQLYYGRSMFREPLVDRLPVCHKQIGGQQSHDHADKDGRK